MKFSQNDPKTFFNIDFKLNSLEKMFFHSKSRLSEGFNQGMFNEDFGNVFRARSYDEDDILEIESNNEELSNKLLSAIITRYDFHRAIRRVVDISNDIASDLICYGKACYFAYKTEDDELIIRSCSPYSLFKAFGLTVQYVPKGVRARWDHEDEVIQRELRFLNRSKVLYFRMPYSIATRIQAQNKLLKVIDGQAHSLAHQFMPRPTHENPSPTNYFDFTVWKDKSDEAMLKATKHTGWSARTTFDHTSDFFHCHRLIRFTRLQVELRDHILKELSHQLTRLGQLEDKGFQLELLPTGKLPSIDGLDNLNAKLTAETTSFKSILDYCYGKEG